jgi:hypothetical protein
MSSNIVIRPGAMPETVTIEAAWVAKRDEIVAECAMIKSVESDVAYDAAARLLNEAKSMSGDLEKMRKRFTDPFLQAQRAIKGAADEARKPLEDAAEAMKKPMTDWVLEKQRRVREEQARIEAEQRRKAEEAAAQAAAEAELFGEDDEPEDIVIEAAPAPVETVARSSAARVTEVVGFTVTDPDRVPRAFMVVDESKLRAYRDLNKDRIKATIKDGKTFDAVAGVEWKITEQIAHTGRRSW